MHTIRGCSEVKTVLQIIASTREYTGSQLYLTTNMLQEGETILLLNSKGDWEYAPSAKREAGVKF